MNITDSYAVETCGEPDLVDDLGRFDHHTNFLFKKGECPLFFFPRFQFAVSDE